MDRPCWQWLWIVSGFVSILERKAAENTKWKLTGSKVYQVGGADTIMLVYLVENAADGFQLVVLHSSGALIR